ncbi:MAG: carboxypeptidase-like regulatory domain-containing protein [Paludibacter sp.]
MLSETKFTITDLRHVSALELTNICNGLYSRIDENLSELKPYSLTVESQTIYRGAIDAFKESIPQPRSSQLKSKENTRKEGDAFATADEAIAEIDALVEIVKLSEPDFYTGYRNARKIVEQGTGSLQVKGTVSEAATDKAIPGAVLTFRPEGQTETVIQKETAAKGGFNIKSLAEGVYEVSVSKVGFKTRTVTATVRWDELCNIDVVLEKATPMMK